MAHHPDRAADRVRYGKRGAKISARGKVATELKGLYERVEKLTQMVEAGEMERSTASVIGQLHNIARAILRDLLLAREQEELIARLENLEQQLEQSHKQDRQRGRRLG
jgi:hypothetical protein